MASSPKAWHGKSRSDTLLSEQTPRPSGTCWRGIAQRKKSGWSCRAKRQASGRGNRMRCLAAVDISERLCRKSQPPSEAWSGGPTRTRTWDQEIMSLPL